MTIQIQGVIVPLLSPLSQEENIDIPSLHKLVEYVIEGGVSAIFALGTSGEAPSLSFEQRYLLVRSVAEIVKGRIPILAGVIQPSTKLMIEEGHRLAKLGVDGLVITPPYYYSYTQEELVDHYETLSRSFDLPIIIYNIPALVTTQVGVPTIGRLMAETTIAGIKDSEGDMSRFQAILDLRERNCGFKVWQGAEALAAISIVRGADGVVLGLANVAPDLCVNLYQVAKSGDLDAAWKLQSTLMQLFTIQRHKSFLSGLKEAASCLGLCLPIVSKPFSPLDDDEKAAVRQTLVDVGLLSL